LIVSFFGILEVAHERRPVVLQEVIVHCLSLEKDYTV
jgi:hypothetical protein